MVSSLRVVALTSTMLITLLGRAQDNCPFAPIDITLAPNQTQQLEVWLRAVDDFNENFSSISFTIRWFDADGVSLGSIVNEPPFVGVGTSGPEHVNGIYRYQIYASTTSVPLQFQPEEFSAGEEVLYARINILGGSSFFELTDDQFTADYNGLYYVSLNGYPCTGEIYTFSTGGVQAGTAAPEVTVSPNPSAGLSAVNIVLSERADLNFELFDPAGRRIWQQARPGRAGQHTEQLAMQNLADGVYVLQVRIGDRVSTHRVVLSGGR